ncbi:MAG: hypothetical protein M1825_006110 [Sarcosagium campestre]|nr:MAG: hypothetical protein M1825_006110 [Sarcosagium campestre]
MSLNSSCKSSVSRFSVGLWLTAFIVGLGSPATSAATPSPASVRAGTFRSLWERAISGGATSQLAAGFDVPNYSPSADGTDWAGPAVNASNVACLCTYSKALCLPSGTYWLPTSTYNGTDEERGAFQLREVSLLVMPAGSSVEMRGGSAEDLRAVGRSTRKPVVFKTNSTDPTRSTLNTDIALRTAGVTDLFELVVSVPQDPPLACVFRDPNYRGNVTCLRPGKSIIEPWLGADVNSVKLHGDARANSSWTDAKGKVLAVAVNDDTPQFSWPTDSGHVLKSVNVTI